MIRFWRDRLFDQTWHPSPEELMLYVDGEPGSRRDQVEAHAKRCWSCRLRLEKIEQAISGFMEARNSSFMGAPTFPAQALPEFAARLERLGAQCGGPSLFSRLTREFIHKLSAPRFSPQLAVFLAPLGLMALISLRLNLPQPVSAKEILSRVREAEAQKMEKVPAPVIYEKLELRRTSRSRSETATWEIWNDARNNRLRERAIDPEGKVRGASAQTPLPPLIEDFGEMLRSRRADRGKPLSPANYEVWRASIPRESEEVLEGTLPNGDKATILKVSGQGPFPPDAIVGAEFTVRAADWHPVGQRLFVQKQGEVVDYSLGEVAFDVIALNRVPASIFAEPKPAGEQISHAPAPRLAPVPVHMDLWPAEADLLPREADLTAAEVEAWYALHTVRAYIVRPVAVRMGVGRIEVEGIVDTEERKAEVFRALRGIPHLTTEIRTVAEGAALALPESPDSEAAASPTFSHPDALLASTPKLAIEDLLKRYFIAGKCAARSSGARSTCVQEEIANLSREALAHPEQAQALAWALRRLVQWEPFQKRDGLRTSAQRLIELMVRDHMVDLQNELEQLRAQLKPVLAMLGGDDSGKD